MVEMTHGISCYYLYIVVVEDTTRTRVLLVCTPTTVLELTTCKAERAHHFVSDGHSILAPIPYDFNAGKICMPVRAVHNIAILRMSCTAQMGLKISPTLKFYGIWARICMTLRTEHDIHHFQEDKLHAQRRLFWDCNFYGESHIIPILPTNKSSQTDQMDARLWVG